jgi:Fe-S-cluster containining protein
MSDPVPICLRCGVCCHSDLDTYVRVSGADWERLGVEADRVAHFIGNRAYLRMSQGHCAALAVRPAADDPGAREFFCTIYEKRPRVCRDLERGSPECEGERATKASRVEAGLPHPSKM